MRKGDLLWTAALIVLLSIPFSPATGEGFLTATRTHPYLLGFVKVGILATMGELLAARITHGTWTRPTGLWLRGLVWGFLGLGFTLTFEVFGQGVAAASDHGLLPAAGGMWGSILLALLTSAVMNICFAPVMMAFHRVLETYIALGDGELGAIRRLRLVDVVRQIDWYSFISFVVLKTIPLFWIPAHTITFLFPAEYRVLCSAILSIALGVILSLAKRGAPAEERSSAAA